MDPRVQEHAEILVDWSARVDSGDNVVVSVSEGAHDLAVAVAEALGDRDANLVATYDAAERLNELKARYGYIGAPRAQRVADGITGARELRGRLNAALASEGGEGAASAELQGEIARFSHSTVSDKQELFWQRHLFSFRLPGILKVAADTLRG